MINIILIILILHFLRTIKYKIKYTTLNCGIFAWAGNDPKKFDKAKFDIQGLYNDSRGGDSCGVSTDGEIYYGITTSKHYGRFLIDSNYKTPEMIPTVIGHTRKSSSGTVNAVNAHPFGFGDYNDSFEFIGVHNGTLHNQWDLAKQFQVETSEYKYNQYNVWTYDRTKIDSEILLEILYSSKNFEVLSEYIGGAALLFTNTLEPNVLYAFRGASKLEKHGSKTEVDERPLFYYIENKNSVYISSMEESLTAIGGEANQTLFKMDDNTVYKITDGDIENAEKFVISRENAHQKLYTSYAGNVPNTTTVTGYNKTSEKNKHRSIGSDDLLNIRKEKMEKFYPSDIYMQKLRYYRNGHLLTGIYTWIHDYGLLKLCERPDDIIKESESIINKYFNTSTGFFISDSIKAIPSKVIIMPFKEGSKVPVFYMYEGVMLETELDYKACKYSNKFFTTAMLSEMSKHPIINIHLKSGINDQKIMYKNELYTGNISPISVNKIYNIENGNLVKVKRLAVAIEVVEKNETLKEEEINSSRQCLLPLAINTGNIFEETPTNKGSETSFIDQLIQEQIEKENADCCEISKDSKVQIEAIENIMLPIYLQVQNANTKLKDYNNNAIIKNIIDTNNDYLTTLDEDIEKSYFV